LWIRSARICFIGDSFVSGAFDSECTGFVGRLCAKARARGHDLSPYNLGIRGETSMQIARRWRAEAEVRQAAAQEGRLVFEFGVNDVRDMDGKRQMELAQSLAAAREILTAASRWKPVLMIGPPPTGDEARNARLRDVSGNMEKLCAELSVPYFDSYARLMAVPAYLTDVKSVDGTHPSATGYGLWADAIDSWHPWRQWLP
jgi:acyl-CoA thioesterase I